MLSVILQLLPVCCDRSAQQGGPVAAAQPQLWLDSEPTARISSLTARTISVTFYSIVSI